MQPRAEACVYPSCLRAELRVEILGMTHRLQSPVNHNCNFPVCLGKRREGSMKMGEELENVRKMQQRL